MLATPPFDRSAAVGFSLNPLDRMSEKRDDAAFLPAKREDPEPRIFVLAGDQPVLKRRGEARDPLFSQAEGVALGDPVREVFLGVDPGGAALFAVTIDKALAEPLSAR